jgi:hypothetical protein
MNLNTGTPWSEWALADLRYCMEHGQSIEEIADFLCRDIEEVRAKVTELDPNYPGAMERHSQA